MLRATAWHLGEAGVDRLDGNMLMGVAVASRRCVVLLHRGKLEVCNSPQGLASTPAAPAFRLLRSFAPSCPSAGKSRRNFGDVADAPSSHAFILGQRLEANSLDCR